MERESMARSLPAPTGVAISRPHGEGAGFPDHGRGGKGGRVLFKQSMHSVNPSFPGYR